MLESAKSHYKIPRKSG